jgi:hypothetical protein
MTKMKINKLISTIQKGQKVLSGLTVSQKNTLEKVWDVEHAYYSSALEGSHIDRKEFEKFAEKVA